MCVCWRGLWYAQKASAEGNTQQYPLKASRPHYIDKPYFLARREQHLSKKLPGRFFHVLLPQQQERSSPAMCIALTLAHIGGARGGGWGGGGGASCRLAIHLPPFSTSRSLIITSSEAV